MKKKMKKLLFITMALAMSMSLFACGSSGKDEVEKEAEATTQAVEATTEEISEYTLETFFKENPEVSDAFFSSIATEDDSMTTKGEVKGNELIFTYQYKDTFSEEDVATMSAGFDEEKADFDETYNEIKDLISQANGFDRDKIIITLIYNNGDGSEIWRYTI